MSTQGYYARDWVKVSNPQALGPGTPSEGKKHNLLWLWILLALLVLALLAFLLKNKLFPSSWEKAVVFIKIAIPQTNQVASGSGTIISPDGYILTNKHVILDDHGKVRPNIMVVLNSGEENNEQYPARVADYDPASGQTRGDLRHDWAVLKIDPKGKELAYITIGRSEDLQREAGVYSAGFPLGQQASTSTRGPDLKSEKGTITRTQKDNENHTVVLVHSASLVGGNSGGPLLDESRHFIGINTATAGDDAGRNENLAIPSQALGKGLFHAKDDPYSK